MLFIFASLALVLLLGVIAPPLLVLTAHAFVAPSRNSYGYSSAGLRGLIAQALAHRWGTNSEQEH